MEDDEDRKRYVDDDSKRQHLPSIDSLTTEASTNIELRAFIDRVIVPALFDRMSLLKSTSAREGEE